MKKVFLIVDLGNLRVSDTSFGFPKVFLFTFFETRRFAYNPFEVQGGFSIPHLRHQGVSVYPFEAPGGFSIPHLRHQGF